MCLTAEAFGIFLSIITLNNVSVDDGRVTIHTPQTDVIWLAIGEQWCTGAPGTDRHAQMVSPKPLI